MVGRRSLGRAADEDVHCRAENFFYAFGVGVRAVFGDAACCGGEGKDGLFDKCRRSEKAVENVVFGSLEILVRRLNDARSGDAQ